MPKFNFIPAESTLVDHDGSYVVINQRGDHVLGAYLAAHYDILSSLQELFALENTPEAGFCAAVLGDLIFDHEDAIVATTEQLERTLNEPHNWLNGHLTEYFQFLQADIFHLEQITQNLRQLYQEHEADILDDYQHAQASLPADATDNLKTYDILASDFSNEYFHNAEQLQDYRDR